MSNEDQLKVRAVRIGDKLWHQIKDLASPEDRSVLIRAVLTEYVKKQIKKAKG